MASVMIGSNPATWIDYSIKDGRVLGFDLWGKTLYSEDDKISVPGWESQLVEFVIHQQLHVGENPPMFINRMIRDGLIQKGEQHGR